MEIAQDAASNFSRKRTKTIFENFWALKKLGEKFKHAQT